MPKYTGDPIDYLVDKLDDIEKLIKDGKNADVLDEFKKLTSKLTEMSDNLTLLADSAVTDEVREQQQKEMEQNIISGINTQMRSTSESLNSFTASVNDFKDKLVAHVDKLNGLHVIGRLVPEDKALIQELNRTLSVTNMKGQLSVMKDSIKEAGDQEAAKIQSMGKTTANEVNKAVESAKHGIRDVERDAKSNVRSTLSWVQSIYKNKTWWFWGTISFAVLLIALGITMSIRSYAEKKAASEAKAFYEERYIESKKNMESATYWTYYELTYPKAAKAVKKEYKKNFAE